MSVGLELKPEPCLGSTEPSGGGLFLYTTQKESNVMALAGRALWRRSLSLHHTESQAGGRGGHGSEPSGEEGFAARLFLPLGDAVGIQIFPA